MLPTPHRKQLNWPNPCLPIPMLTALEGIAQIVITLKQKQSPCLCQVQELGYWTHKQISLVSASLCCWNSIMPFIPSRSPIVFIALNVLLLETGNLSSVYTTLKHTTTSGPIFSICLILSDFTNPSSAAWMKSHRPSRPDLLEKFSLLWKYQFQGLVKLTHAGGSM